jgi:NTE family protein
MAWLQEQRPRHRFVLLAAEPEHEIWTERCLELADKVLLVGHADGSPELTPVEAIIARVNERLPVEPAPHQLVLLHSHEPVTGTAAWLDLRSVDVHNHVVHGRTRDVERVLRFIEGKAVGFVFGGGGMRGVAHIGVIQALHERGIFADWVGGTSAGAIIAGAYAIGMDVSDMMRAMRDVVLKPRILRDLTVPYSSVNSGVLLTRVYQTLFGERDIEDCLVHSFYMAAHLTHAVPIAVTRGPVRYGVRASTSIVGIFPPLPDENGDLIIDGGVFNNTPADVMRHLVGKGSVIAVDMGFTVRKRRKYTYGENLNGLRVLWSRVNPFSSRIAVPSISSALMRANALFSISVTDQQTATADLVVKPDTRGYGLFDMEQADPLYRVGYDAGREALAGWPATS